MKKYILIFVAIVAVIGIFAYSNSSKSDQSAFFKDELIKSGLERFGQPIEGFNAFIYLEAFPGFEEVDFDGVETLEGKMTFKDGTLTFERTADNPITSAESMISDEGYTTLMKNFSERIGVNVETEADVATLLEKLHESNGEPNANGDDNTGILPFKSGAMGKVLLGPTCPVEKDPPDPNCADKGYATTIQVIEKNSPKSSLFSSVETDKEGNYKVFLPPGEYELQALGGKTFPRCEWEDITIEPDTMIKIDLTCDTGIR
ncbi:MAG: hypothetical protein COU07_00240 [Candidatus Harrisonbacteria bacterium CG10_big_fil_rev_8_21_14_0_10_40_38]|uniref:Carboxypeptidase regulatory-like domain-containing protein n=1 Tax=Candidatus Harrisonbacteria bacterium CG10_big_fil_rev_8_21_14_0_10_40_38 TaxID=1974583 RepID=A0A2H0UUJ5_9BACT|nr:MAG: hypothetical protein COU07_00240 [Candidatus Harrisonbacteria bacterium CG10_big_fil_rev_8_21_14_0_10_40_38]